MRLTRLWASGLTMITFMSPTIQTGISGVDHAQVQDGGLPNFVKTNADNLELFTYKTNVKCRNIAV